jgi:hypothetical protein
LSALSEHLRLELGLAAAWVARTPVRASSHDSRGVEHRLAAQFGIGQRSFDPILGGNAADLVGPKPVSRALAIALFRYFD